MYHPLYGADKKKLLGCHNQYQSGARTATVITLASIYVKTNFSRERLTERSADVRKVACTYKILINGKKVSADHIG